MPSTTRYFFVPNPILNDNMAGKPSLEPIVEQLKSALGSAQGQQTENNETDRHDDCFKGEMKPAWGAVNHPVFIRNHYFFLAVSRFSAPRMPLILS